MTPRNRRTCVALGALAGVAITACVVWAWPVRLPDQATRIARPPAISPDYRDCVIPPNIAPLNFLIQEDGSAYRVRVHAPNGESIVLGGRSPTITIPGPKWRTLLEQNRGGTVNFDVYVKADGGTWRQYQTITNRIADEEIDPYLYYRLIGPTHNVWNNMVTCVREMGSFDERAVVRFPPGSGQCVNCHAFGDSRAERFSMQIRGAGGGMLIGRNGVVEKVNPQTEFTPSASFTTWHPFTDVIAFSTNTPRLLHLTAGESRYLFDYDSDLGIMDVASGEISSTSGIAHPDRLETNPTWSPDGRYLYFCSAPKTWSDDLVEQHGVPGNFAQLQYDLMRIGYDAQTRQWGELETVLSAEELGKSFTLPRISPDGRFLLLCGAQAGAFALYYPDSDLYMLDLESGDHWRLEACSDLSESWHSWSSNGRWIVFSSKRRDGIFTKLYFSYVDAQGRSYKPVLLPQKDPTFYDTLLKAYNLPELLTDTAALDGQALHAAIDGPVTGRDVSAVSSATPITRTPEDATPTAPPVFYNR